MPVKSRKSLENVLILYRKKTQLNLSETCDDQITRPVMLNVNPISNEKCCAHFDSSNSLNSVTVISSPRKRSKKYSWETKFKLPYPPTVEPFYRCCFSIVYWIIFFSLQNRFNRLSIKSLQFVRVLSNSHKRPKLFSARNWRHLQKKLENRTSTRVRFCWLLYILICLFIVRKKLRRTCEYVKFAVSRTGKFCVTVAYVDSSFKKKKKSKNHWNEFKNVVLKVSVSNDTIDNKNNNDLALYVHRLYVTQTSAWLRIIYSAVYAIRWDSGFVFSILKPYTGRRPPGVYVWSTIQLRFVGQTHRTT